MNKTTKYWISIFMLHICTMIVVALVFYNFIPELLCYPPNSINNDFQIYMNGLTYTEQYISILLSSLVFESCILFFNYKKIKKLRLNLINDSKQNYTKNYYAVSKAILKVPSKIAIIQVVVPILLILSTFSVLSSTIENSAFVSAKVSIIFFSLLILIATISYIFSIKIFKKILTEIFYEINDSANIDSDFTKYVKRSSITNTIFIVTIPIFVVTALITTFMGYYLYVNETGDLTYQIYNNSLDLLEFDETTSQSEVSYIYSKLLTIDLNQEADSFYIINKDTKEVALTSNGSTLSDFFIEYTYMVSPTLEQSNRTYDFYGVDSQGAFKTITLNGEEWIIGIKYTLNSEMVLLSLILINFLLLGVTILLLLYFSKYISNDIKRISDSLSEIYKNKNSLKEVHNLPIISNDEIGDLAHDFNKIQKLTVNNINQIYNSQEMLMEKERLASLRSINWWYSTQLENSNNVNFWCC